MIAVMSWPKHIILLLKLTLMVELWTFLSSISCHCLSTRFSTFIGSSYSSLEIPTKILSTLPCNCHHALTLTCQNSPWWLSGERCKKFLLDTIAHLTRTPWSSCDVWWMQSLPGYPQGWSKTCYQECGYYFSKRPEPSSTALRSLCN